MIGNKISRFLILFLILLLIVGEKYAYGDEKSIPYSLCKKISTVKFPYHLRWSPDGSEICFLDIGNVTPKDIYFIKTDTGKIRKMRPLFLTQKMDSEYPLHILGPAPWSPDGTEIALWIVGRLRRKYIEKILIISPKISTNYKIASENGILYTMNNCWSPDGKKIFYISRPNPDISKLIIIDSETLKPIQTYSGSLSKFCPSWSSDGGKIYYLEEEKSGEYLFCSIEVTQEKNKRKVIAHIKSPAYWISPNCEHIAWVNKDKTLWTMKIDGLDKKMIFKNTSKDSLLGGIGGIDLSWSPDGKKIIFNLSFLNYNCPSPQLIRSSIWLINSDGTGLFQISHPDVRFSHSPVWSPDGRRIAFTTYFAKDKFKGAKDADLTIKDIYKLDEATNYNYNICIVNMENFFSSDTTNPHQTFSKPKGKKVDGQIFDKGGK